MSVFEFSSGDVQKELSSAHARGELHKALRAHLQRCVPHVYTGLMNADTAKEETKAKKYVFQPFEVFLCDGDPEVVFQQLKEEDTPAQLCGKVFKLGEPTYSCRDCGTDPTCVLCSGCFKGSAHRDHRYRMSTSKGGGYCDCGDIEAWRSEPFCDNHKRCLNSVKKDALEVMREDLKSRAQALFSSVIRTATELLLWDDGDCLPSDLKPDKLDDTYVTMLFNDEVHTYEQVINALTKAVNAEPRKAVQFATTVDREGRSPVKDGDFKECEQAKEIIEKQTARHGSAKPLKTFVMHTSVVAFQVLAMRLLSWLQEVTNQTEGLRKLFCKIMMEKEWHEDQCIVEKLMLADTKLWKAARVQMHELVMSGVLLDQECKKTFAVIFTRIYPHLMEQYKNDDHDYTVCVVSETVQIFTVPTLARMLITEYNLLEVILGTFLSECENKINKNGTFVFEKQARHQSFRRAQDAFYDLKYALACQPSSDEWTDALRHSFLCGFSAMLKLFGYIQNMDAVTRQAGQHIEYDPEWETSFILQLKLKNAITVMLDWCGSDKTVLIEAYRKSVDLLEEFHSNHEWQERELGGHTVPCIQYDVSKSPVSVHVPLNRIVARLFAKAAKFNMSPSELFTCSSKNIGAEQMMEPSLRCLVLVAQTHANMWKRNGYSLLNQIYHYQYVHCRSEMYDRDILMLQTAAALLDSNHFVIHVLNKFGLNAWKDDNYDSVKHDELNRYTVILAEEFLNLLLLVVGERFVVGVGDVTKEDVIKHEIVHQLCLHPMSHSELSKTLPEDPYHETGMESVVSQVAQFKKPSSAQGKGMYELNEEYYKEYNPFFYHYSRQEQSAAIDAYKARKKQQATEATSQAFCPPVPPAWTPGYNNAALLLNCDALHRIMNLVLSRGLEKRSKSWSETQFEKVLFLIGMALYEERRFFEDGDISFNFVEKARQSTRENETCLCAKLEEYLSQNRGVHQGQRELLSWVLKTFNEVRQIRYTSLGISDLPMEVSMEDDEKTVKEKKKKADLAAKRRARIMTQMSRMQKIFIQENAELFETTSTEFKRVSSDMDISQPRSTNIIVVGPEKSAPENYPQLLHTCILCQEEQQVTTTSRVMVLASFVQKSTVLSQERGKYIADGENHNPLFMCSSLIQGTYTNTCGHVMHADCWQGFYDNVIIRERRRALRFRHMLNYDLENCEYLCPYCKSISNTVIPIVPYLHSLAESETKDVQLTLPDWIDGIQKTVRNSIQESKQKESDEEKYLLEPCPLPVVTKLMTKTVAQNFQQLFEYIYDDSSARFGDGLTNMLKKFATDTYAIGLGVLRDENNERVPVMSWNACAYTIMTTEQILRYEDKAVFGEGATKYGDCLGALVRIAAVCSHVVDKSIIKKHCVNLLSALVLESKERRAVETPCILDIDLFHYLVSLSLSLPTLYTEGDAASRQVCRTAEGGLNDLHILQLTFTAHLVQIMLSATFSQQDDMDAEADADALELLGIYQDIRSKPQLRTEFKPSCHQLVLYLENAVLPFLRCCAIFYQRVTAVSEPQLSTDDESKTEFEILCQYLSLPTNLSQLFSIVPSSLIDSWCQDERVKTKFMTGSGEPTTPLVTYPLKINHLVALPKDYSELINRVSSFTCPNSNGDESRTPTMCLVCGEMLCSQSYCCQIDIGLSTPVGAATGHTKSVGAGTGIYLRVRECQILMLGAKARGCFYSAPYVDNYGETDQGLSRGNPLHLCMDRYTKLQKLWLSHSIPDQIARHLESNSALMAIEWHHL